MLEKPIIQLRSVHRPLISILVSMLISIFITVFIGSSLITVLGLVAGVFVLISSIEQGIESFEISTIAIIPIIYYILFYILSVFICYNSMRKSVENQSYNFYSDRLEYNDLYRRGSVKVIYYKHIRGIEYMQTIGQQRLGIGTIILDIDGRNSLSISNIYDYDFKVDKVRRLLENKLGK